MAHIDEANIEEETIEILEKLGYTHINAWKHKLIGRDNLKDVVLKDKLQTALIKLNKTLPNSCIESAIRELTKSRATQNELEANQEIYKLIKDGVPTSFVNEDGKDELATVKVVDFEEFKQNDFLVVSQLTIEYLSSTGTRRPDLILYVNGLPLVMLELKNATEKVKKGYDDNLQTYRRDIPQLFYYNLFVGISNGIQTRVGSFIAPWEHFFSWAKLEDNVVNHKQASLLSVEKQSEDEKSQLSLELFCNGLCAKKSLLDYTENFVLYHKNRVKIIAKNHQFLGVNVALDSFKKRDGSGKLGTFWHTQGSGKSYSMIFFTKKIKRKVEGNWSFLILTDRNDLDDQIFKNFVDTGAITLSVDEKQEKNEYRAKGSGSRKQLEEALSKNKSYYFSTIFNFGIKKGKTYTKKSDRDDWIVIVDEAHRSQYKGLGENIRIALPNAQFMAFTGTPLINKGNEKGETEKWFGSYVSEYNFAQSIEDGATVPLYYKKSVPSVAQINEDLSDEALEIINKYDINDEQQQKLDKEYSTLFEVVKRDDRLDEVAKHIVKHFPTRLNVKNDEGRRKPMKAMVVSIDKFTAVKMYDKVQDALKEEVKELMRKKAKAKKEDEKREIQDTIDFINETKMAVVISQEGSDKEEAEKFSSVGLDITKHRKLMSEPDDNGSDIEDFFKDPNNKYRIVFVTAMWMTGFDAPSVSTLYLDKPMKNHTLMQTIARANRVFEAKKNGLVIDYFGVFRNLKKALSDYAEGSSGTSSPLDMPVQEFEKLLELLEEAIEKCKAYLLSFDVDVNAIHNIGEKSFAEIELFKSFANTILESDDRRKELNLFVNTIVALYDSAKPEVYEHPHLKKERDLLVYLKNIVNRKLDRDEEITKARKEVDELLDRSILGNGDLENSVKIIEGKKINLGQLDFEKLKKEFPKKPYKNTKFTDLKEFMELKLKQMMAFNKTRGNFLAEFEKVVDEYNDGSIEIEEAYERLIKQAENLTKEEERYIREGFANEEELEMFDLLKKEKLSKDEVKKVKKAAKELLKTLQDKKREIFVYNWYNEKKKKEELKHEIMEVLDRELPTSYDRNIFTQKNEKVYSHIYHLAELGDELYACA
jgi:type I restriction enzyme R subunit